MHVRALTYFESRWEWDVPGITLDRTTIKVAVHHKGAATDPETVDRRVHPDDVAFWRSSLADA